MRDLQRRQFLALAAGVATSPAISRAARAQAYPSRPIRMLVGFAPGGGTDVMARLMQPTLNQQLGQQIVIENRPGAGTNIATEAVVHAAPDGYTLLAASLANAGNATLYGDLKFNFIRDTVPVAGIALDPFVLEVTPSLPVNSIPELIAYAKAHPGKVNYGSGGIGSGNQLTAEMLKMMTGIDLVHVPYRRAGKLRALGVATRTRQAALPDVPTVAEFVPGYEASFWTGIAAPKGTPAAIVDKLNKAVNAGFADANVKARLGEWGATAITGSPADFAKFVADETEKWGKVIRTANIKAE